MRNGQATSGSDPPDLNASGDMPQSAVPRGANRPKRKRKRISQLSAFLIKLAMVAAILAGMFFFILGVHIQRGIGMYPHIKDGDLLITFTFKLDHYRVEDVVLYRRPDTGEKSVARIKARGVNEIRFTESGELMVNGVIIESEQFYPTMPVLEGGIDNPYQMSDRGFFLLNDHRTSGSDSRLFGEVTEDDLLGKVVYVFRRRGI